MDESIRRRVAEAKAQLKDRKSNPKLRAATERILAMPIDARLRQIEAEANFFMSIRPLDGSYPALRDFDRDAAGAADLAG